MLQHLHTKKDKIANFKDEIDDLKYNDSKSCSDIEKQHTSYMGLHAKMFHEILTSNASIKNDTRDIKQVQGKHNLIIIGLVFVAGMLIGAEYRIWLPYATTIVTTIKNAKAITR